MDPRNSARLAQKRNRPELQSPSPPPPPPPKRRKTASESTRDWKEGLKINNPTQYEAYKERCRESSRSYRQNADEEKKAQLREQSRLRMQKMRQKKKESEQPQQPMTRGAQDDQRKKWRVAKKKWWDGLHPQKQRRLKEKRSQREKDQRSANKAQRPNSPMVVDTARADRQVPGSWEAPETPQRSTPPEDHNSSGTGSTSLNRTPAARRKATSRVKAVLPKSPSKKAETIIDLISTLSPRKKKLILQTLQPNTPSQIAQSIGETVLHELNDSKKKRSKASLQSRKLFLTMCKKHRSFRATSSFLGISRTTTKTFVGESSKLHFKKENREKKMEKEVSNFFESVACPVPDKKLVSSKSGKPTAILMKPLKELHEDFLTMHPNNKKSISFSHFAKCRPRHVQLRQNWRLRLCLCEYCTNVDLKLRTVNAVAGRFHNQSRIRHAFHAIDLLTCGRQNGNWLKQCAYRECAACQNKSLEQHLQPLLRRQEPVSWIKWENRVTEINGKRATRKAQVRKEGRFADLVQELQEEVTFLAGHLFRANWQHSQFVDMRKTDPFPVKTVGMVLDFAENFSCQYQDEIQAAHWHHNQGTVHPIVCYYRCPACPETVTESLVMISNESSHDYDAVFEFTKVAMNHLRNTRGLQIEHVVQWTDGCAAQYKSRGPFADISHALGDFGCTWERNFFGSRHGKGPSDGESAVVKHGASVAVRAGTAMITTAEELFDFVVTSRLHKQPAHQCGEKTHFFRSFFWVPAEDIHHQRNRSVKTLKGTRQLHSVRCVQPNMLCTRELTCLCRECQTGVGECRNLAVAGPWVQQTLRRIQPRVQLDPANEPAFPAPQDDDVPAPTHDDDVPAPTHDDDVLAPTHDDDVLAPTHDDDVLAPTHDVPAPTHDDDVPAPTHDADAPVPHDDDAPAPSPLVDAPAAATGGDAELHSDPHDGLVPPVGSFVLVALNSDRRPKRTVKFFAKILEVDFINKEEKKADILVHYLGLKPGRDDLYIWSEKSWISPEQIVATVNAPTLVPGRGIAFKF